jgi:hypothetical protein
MRQKRDKIRSRWPGDDDHSGIPRDANGDPIFLILPPIMRVRYEEKMAQCEAAWRQGEPLAVAEAAELARIYRQPISAWLGEAAVELAIRRRTPAQAKRHLEAQKDLKTGIPGHYEPAADLTWDEARAEAARMLEGTLAKGDESTMKRAYDDVKRDLNAGRSGKYFVLKDWRYRNNGKPDPNGPAKAG